MTDEAGRLSALEREVLIDTLVYHQATHTSGCHCGWAVLGASHAEHVVAVYQLALAARRMGLGGG